MLTYLNRINFVLLLAIGAVCLLQWNVENDARARINALQRSNADHQNKIAELDENLKGANEDLDRFRGQVSELKALNDKQTVDIRGQKADLFRLEEARAQLAKQTESLRKALDSYKAAVESRDENIKTLLEQREQLHAANKNAVEKANQAINAYNDVNGKYADLVGRYNELAARYQALAPAPQPQESDKAKASQ
jgi:chromosome segregation ATPase